MEPLGRRGIGEAGSRFAKPSLFLVKTASSQVQDRRVVKALSRLQGLGFGFTNAAKFSVRLTCGGDGSLATSFQVFGVQSFPKPITVPSRV